VLISRHQHLGSGFVQAPTFSQGVPTQHKERHGWLKESIEEVKRCAQPDGL
jgi:hypothetical protein